MFSVFSWFMEIRSSEEITAFKIEFVLGRDTKTPTTLPKSIPISVPGPSGTSTPSTSKKQLLFMSPFSLFVKINYGENHSTR